MITQEQIRIANATSRSSGAVGRKAIVPQMAEEYLNNARKIGARVVALDYGAGKDAIHTRDLQSKGHFVIAHEFGANKGIWHSNDALQRKYDMVFASNVLNEQSSREMLEATLAEIHSLLAPHGRLYCNYPESPRKCPNLSFMGVIYHMRAVGFYIENFDKSKCTITAVS